MYLCVALYLANHSSIIEQKNPFFNPFTNDKFLTSKLKEFADINSVFYVNGRKFSKRDEKYFFEKEILLNKDNFSFSHSVFKRLVQQTCKNQGLVWERVNN